MGGVMSLTGGISTMSAYLPGMIVRRAADA